MNHLKGTRPCTPRFVYTRSIKRAVSGMRAGKRVESETGIGTLFCAARCRRSARVPTREPRTRWTVTFSPHVHVLRCVSLTPFLSRSLPSQGCVFLFFLSYGRPPCALDRKLEKIFGRSRGEQIGAKWTFFFFTKMLGSILPSHSPLKLMIECRFFPLIRNRYVDCITDRDGSRSGLDVDLFFFTKRLLLNGGPF